LATNTVRAGDLDRRVAFQQSTKTYSPSGELIEGWATLAQRWAAVRPLLGDERSADAQWVAREQVEFRVRWDSSIQYISPLDRVVFPASDAATEIPRSIYDIFAVHEIGRHVALQVMAARQSSSGTPPATVVTVGRGMVGYWPLDPNTITGTTVLDKSGHGRNGTIVGALPQLTGQVGGALQFSPGNYVDMGSITALKPSIGTFAIWAFPTLATNQAMMGWEDYATDRNGAMLWLNGSSGAVLELADGVAFQPIAGGSVPPNAWSRIVGTWNGATASLYVNGVVVNSVPQTRIPAAGTNPFRIGSSGATGAVFNGRLDDVRVANVDWTAAEVAADYQAGLVGLP